MNNTVKWVIGVIVVAAIVWFGFMNKSEVKEEAITEDTTTEEVMDVEVNIVVVDPGVSADTEVPTEEVAQ